MKTVTSKILAFALIANSIFGANVDAREKRRPHDGPPEVAKQFMNSALERACGAELNAQNECREKRGPEKLHCLIESGIPLSSGCGDFALQAKNLRKAKEARRVRDMECSYNGSDHVDASDSERPVCLAVVSCKDSSEAGLSFSVPVFCRPSKDDHSICPSEPKQCLRQMHRPGGRPGMGPGQGRGRGPSGAEDESENILRESPVIN